MVAIEPDLKADFSSSPLFQQACIVAVLLLDVMNPDVSQSEE